MNTKNLFLMTTLVLTFSTISAADFTRDWVDSRPLERPQHAVVTAISWGLGASTLAVLYKAYTLMQRAERVRSVYR